MGDQSRERFLFILPPQLTPICATQPRFCLPYNVQLHLKQNFWSMSGADFKIMDANDKAKVYFRCKGRVFPWSGKIFLNDDVGVPVLKHSGDKVKIFAGEGNEPKVYEFKSRLSTLIEVSTKFTDVLNGEFEHHFILKSSTSSTFTTICSGDPENGGIPLAFIYRPLMRYYGNQYIMEVAANVDVAICVMMCIDFVTHGPTLILKE